MRIESGSFAATFENMNDLPHQGKPECREEKVTLIGEKPVEECQVGSFFSEPPIKAKKTELNFQLEPRRVCKKVSVMSI